MVEAAIAIRSNLAEPLCAYLYVLDALERHVRAVRAGLPASCELFCAVKAQTAFMIDRAAGFRKIE